MHSCYNFSGNNEQHVERDKKKKKIRSECDQSTNSQQLLLSPLLNAVSNQVDTSLKSATTYVKSERERESECVLKTQESGNLKITLSLAGRNRPGHVSHLRFIN